jgi:hypothetical protein
MILIKDPNKGWWHTLWEYSCVHNIINNLQSNENIEYIDNHPQLVFQEHELHMVLCRQQNTCVICFKACSLNCYCLFGVSKDSLCVRIEKNRSKTHVNLDKIDIFFVTLNLG